MGRAWPSESSQDLVSVKKLEFLRPFEIMFCFVSAELKRKSLLTTPYQNSNVDNILPDLDTGLYILSILEAI